MGLVATPRMMKFRPFAALAFLALSAVGMARWANIAQDVPLDTVLRNLEQRVRKSPKDAQAHYLLGRIHSMAFASGEKTVHIVPLEKRGEKGQMFPPYATIRVPVEANAPMTPERLRHLRRSIEEYKAAVRLDPKNPLYALGLGWMHEMAIPTDMVTGRGRADLAADAYRRVIRLREKAERAMPTYGLGADGRLAQEAALGLTRLLSGRRDRAGVNEYRRMVALAAELAKKPAPITPIVVPLAGETSLSSLLAPGRSSGFDLIGDGIKRDWPWVKPATGILVWDPLDTGKITSGRQLFGNSTWWMFFRDGYEALATLDSDRNGWLEREELMGIRVWQDANGNGVSDPGEVRTLAHHRISALRTQASHRDSNGPRAEVGIRQTDGTTAPTFDWTPTSLRLR